MYLYLLPPNSYLLVFTRRLRQGCLSADGMFGRVTLDATSAPLLCAGDEDEEVGGRYLAISPQGR